MHLYGQAATAITHLNTERAQWLDHHRHGAMTQRALTLDTHRLATECCDGRKEACRKSRLANIQGIGRGPKATIYDKCVVILDFDTRTERSDSLDG